MLKGSDIVFHKLRYVILIVKVTFGIYYIIPAIKKIHSNSVITNSDIKEHLVIANKFLGQIGQFSTQINPVITNPGYNERTKMAGPELFVITEFECTLMPS